jgi:5-methylcytosine-specific restriction enzyme subunit McrC
MRRTLVLTERRPRRVRLSPADVEFLLASHARRIDVAPTGRRGVVQLTPRGCAGVVVAPTLRLVIHPKIPLQNLFFLLDSDDPAPAIRDEAAPAPGIEVLDFLAGRLARLLTERSAAGLRRGYRERADEGPFLHGRIDVPAQLRESPGRKDRLHSRHDDFTVDVPCNRAPRATAERLLSSMLLSERVREALRMALRSFDEVRSGPLTPDLFAAAEADRLAEGYGPLLDLCRLLADALGPTGAAGPTACPAFLLDMEHVFERYVTRGVLEAFADQEGWTAAPQETHVVAAGVEMRPDVTVHRDGRPALVVDAKWKRPAGAPSPADLYQMLAYCTAVGVGRAVLVYPGRRDGMRIYALRNAPIRVEMRTLRVVGDGAACRRSLRRLGRGLMKRQDRA